MRAFGCAVHVCVQVRAMEPSAVIVEMKRTSDLVFFTSQWCVLLAAFGFFMVGTPPPSPGPAIAFGLIGMYVFVFNCTTMSVIVAPCTCVQGHAS